MSDRTQKEFYEEAQAFLSKEMDRIEKWLKCMPSAPRIDHVCSYDGVGSITSVRPMVVASVDKDAMLSEWSSIRSQVEWFKDVSDEVDI